MAGWFFFVIGGVLVASSLLVWAWNDVIAWLIALTGLVALSFGALAPRETRVTAAMVVLALLQL